MIVGLYCNYYFSIDIIKLFIIILYSCYYEFIILLFFNLLEIGKIYGKIKNKLFINDECIVYRFGISKNFYLIFRVNGGEV